MNSTSSGNEPTPMHTASILGNIVTKAIALFLFEKFLELVVEVIPNEWEWYGLALIIVYTPFVVGREKLRIHDHLAAGAGG